MSMSSPHGSSGTQDPSADPPGRFPGVPPAPASAPEPSDAKAAAQARKEPEQ